MPFEALQASIFYHIKYGLADGLNVQQPGLRRGTSLNVHGGGGDKQVEGKRWDRNKDGGIGKREYKKRCKAKPKPTGNVNKLVVSWGVRGGEVPSCRGKPALN